MLKLLVDASGIAMEFNPTDFATARDEPDETDSMRGQKSGTKI